MVDPRLPQPLKAPPRHHVRCVSTPEVVHVTPASRREFLGTAAVMAAAAVAGAPPAWAASTPKRMALHLHSSFSEGPASLANHFQQAALHGFHVLSLSEHDWRMTATAYREAFHFSGLRESEFGRDWVLVFDRGAGLSVNSSASISDVASPNDPSSAKGSLHLAVVSTSADPATFSCRLSDDPSNSNMTNNVSGTTLALDVLSVSGGSDGTLEALITLSIHPAKNGLSRGNLQLLYRFRPDIAVTTRTTEGLRGIIDVPVAAGSWTTVSLPLLSDIAALFDAYPPADNALVRLDLRATSRNLAQVEGYLANLRFVRDRGVDPLAVQAELQSYYAALYPGLTLLSGMEFSLGPHINGFGPGGRFIYDYGAVTQLYPPLPADTGTRIIEAIHARGGVATLNHPFGTNTTLLSDTAQNAARRTVVQALLASRANGADALEVGYRKRGGATLETHLKTWDACSRNGLWITGTGVSDDHSGQGWKGLANRFFTSAWAPTTGEADLIAALRRGEVFVGELSRFTGFVDVRLAGNPMGSISVRTDAGLATRTLTVAATGIPSGGSLRVKRGSVDYAGASSWDTAARLVKTLGPSSLATGTASFSVDTRTSAYFRVEIVDAAGVVIAFSNPVWQLREAPPEPVPPYRRAPS